MADTNINICDINIMPSTCRNRFVQLWSTKRQDVLLTNGIIHSGLGENKKGYEFARKDPDFHVVIVTRSGEGRCRDQSRVWRNMQKGDIITLPAHVAHHYTTVKNSWDHFWFHIKDDDDWSFLKNDIATIRKARYPDELEKLLTCYYTESIRDDDRSTDVLWHIGEAVLHFLRRELKDRASAKISESSGRLNVLMQNMRSYPAKSWSLAEIAESLCFSKMHAIRQFKAQTGLTPFEFLTLCRMQFAAQQLAYTTEKVHVIGTAAGYTDQFAFSVAFKRFFKVSPRAYRKKGDEKSGGASLNHGRRLRMR